MRRDYPRALVCHPGRQHSQRLAAGLSAGGFEVIYLCGTVASGGGGRGAGGLVEAVDRRVLPVAPILRRVLGALGGRLGEQLGDYLGNRWFDRLAERWIRGSRPDVVVGYEISCARTFEAARLAGISTILDAASLHHASQDRWRRPEEPPWLHCRIVAVKDRELRSTNRVLVASTVARTSYREAGFPDDAIRTASLGVDLSAFRQAPRAESSTFRLLFVGKLSRTKGFDLLLEAFEALRRSELDCSVEVVGQGRWDESLPPGVVSRSVPHDRLAEVYSAVDLLVLPSRFDGYGMVVSEALACGTPVVVSDRVGAGDLVREGVNGWVVEADSVERLRERLDWCIRHPEAVRALRPACRSSVEGHGWDAYSRRVVEVVRELLDERRS